MGNTTVSAGEEIKRQSRNDLVKGELFRSINLLFGWLEDNDYKGYDAFDGLNARFLRPLTLEKKTLRITLQQSVRRFIFNVRPLLGIKKCHSSKGMGFLARGFLRLYQSTGDAVWAEKAKSVLQWLIDNRSKGYSGACWGNHFDYQSRGFYLPKGMPTIVWTSLIGHAFLDAYDLLKKDQYLEVATSCCDHILRDIQTYSYGDAVCISYVPGIDSRVHNANTLGASLLARTYASTGTDSYIGLATRAFQYTANFQRSDGSWYYGEAQYAHWVDNFHTGYVLDCFKYYLEATGDDRFLTTMTRGYDYWKKTFFLADGTPRYYNHKTLPLDIQCCSQAIDTLVFFRNLDPGSLALALKVARWTIRDMQDPSGYFYYRRYSPWLVNKTPTLHWGQATMLCALAGLYSSL